MWLADLAMAAKTAYIYLRANAAAADPRGTGGSVRVWGRPLAIQHRGQRPRPLWGGGGCRGRGGSPGPGRKGGGVWVVDFGLGRSRG